MIRALKMQIGLRMKKAMLEKLHVVIQDIRRWRAALLLERYTIRVTELHTLQL